MRSLLPLLAAAVAQLMGLSDAQNGFVCDIPTAGCTNGMFNQDKCECECISPFCPDINGDCLNPSNSCGGNPWASCTRGEDCPWWVNPLKAESCTTGPRVPVGLWNIYNTKTACCNTNFAYSTTCDAPPASGQPTKHPTIAAPEDDDYEVIPIKFDVGGLPDGIKMRELKEEMTTVLKRILLRLAERIPNLKISSIEEKVVLSRNLEKALRALEQDVTLYFNVYVIRDDDRKFGPLIINEIRDSYDEVLDQIQTFSDTKYFGGDLNMNWCTSENGKFTVCVTEIFDPPPPTGRMPTPTVVVHSVPGGGGLPGWAVALLVSSGLLFLCCVGYFIFVSCFGHSEGKEVENNIFLGDKSGDSGYWDGKSRSGSRSKGKSSRSRRSRSRGGKSRRSRRYEDDYEEDDHQDDGDVQIVLAQPEDPSFDQDNFTINTYGTKTQKRVARDPTMYIPGQEDKPDPDSSVLMITDGASSSRRYMEDPPLKPKRDPTFYGDGGSSRSYAMEDPPLKPKRDPTMYMDGSRAGDPGVYDDMASAQGGYSVRSAGGEQGGTGAGYSVNDPYGMSGIDGSEVYDDYDFKHSELEAQYMTSETNAEYATGVASHGRDPSFFASEEDMSFRTEEPSEAGHSERPKKSKKKKKKSSR
jgi:hypothetical protein